MQVRVLVQAGERGLHRGAHAHFIQVAHVEHFQPGFVHQPLFAGSTLRMPIWRTQAASMSG